MCNGGPGLRAEDAEQHSRFLGLAGPAHLWVSPWESTTLQVVMCLEAGFCC